MSRATLMLPLMLLMCCGLEPVSGRYHQDELTPPADGGNTAPTDPSEPSCKSPWRGDLHLGTELDDEATDLWIDPDGTLFVTGYQQGITGQENIEPSGNSKGVVIRISPSGRVNGTTTFETGGADVVESVTRDVSTGRLFVAGRTTGAFPGQLNAGQFDTFVATLDAAGNIEHLKQDGTDAPQHPRRIQTLPGGQIFIGGYDDIYVPSNYVERWEDPFIGAYNFDERRHDTLMPQWVMPFATLGTDLGTDLAADATGVYLTGMTASGRQKGPFIRKLAHDGSALWWKRVPGATGDSMNAVLVTPQGKLYAAGTSFLQIGNQGYGQQDAFVMELNPDTGDLMRAMQFGGPESEWVTSMASDAQGNIYVGGVSDTVSLNPERPHEGLYDVFVIRFNPKGEVTGLWEAGSPGEDWLTAVRVDSCGRVFVVGYSDAFASGPTLGRRDIFVMQAEIEPYSPPGQNPHTQDVAGR